MGLRLGYSFWGFIGPGITDTPDGGRSFRRTVLDHLCAHHHLHLLQENRDLTETGLDLTDRYTWDAELPELDALLLEWRWPLPGRNTTTCGTPGHTCDLHRQQQLLDHYTRHGVRTLIWDLDQTLDPDDELRHLPGVVVAEPALHPVIETTPTLLTPVDDAVLEHTDPEQLAAETRPLPLTYLGNQYRRDEMFDAFFAAPARTHRHQVAGKWTDTARWPHVNFTGRIGYTEGQQLLRRSSTTVTILPEPYAATGHMTQRLAEAVTAGCLPIGPTSIRGIDRFIPASLHADNGEQVAETISRIVKAPAATRAALLADCLAHLEIFRASRFTTTVNALLHAN
jgi:hypothetical protein